MCQTELITSPASLTHVPGPANPVSNHYQKARVNVYVNPAIRHQLDALSGEWGVPVTEAFRRVLSQGLRDIMHTDSPINGQLPATCS